MKNTNETVTVIVSSPLLRPGLSLSAAVSKKYAADAATDMLEIARAINSTSSETIERDSNA